MKSTEQTKIYLQKALLNAPDDFALSEVRFHLRAALNKLETVEKKRQKRETAYQERKEKAVATQNAYDPAATLRAIDEMIAEEKAKIDEIHRRRNAPKGGEIEDNEDLQLLG